MVQVLQKGEKSKVEGLLITFQIGERATLTAEEIRKSQHWLMRSGSKVNVLKDNARALGK